MFMKKFILSFVAIAPLLLLFAACKNNTQQALTHDDSMHIYAKVIAEKEGLKARVNRPLKPDYVNACQKEYLRLLRADALPKDHSATTSVSFALDGRDGVGDGMGLRFIDWYAIALSNTTYKFTHLTIIPGVYVSPNGYNLDAATAKYIDTAMRRRPDGSIIAPLKGSITYFLRSGTAVSSISPTGRAIVAHMSGTEDFNLGDLQP